jgi:hypothetical protein
MNLIKIQDALNKLPPNAESIQYLTAAAQGGNPQVPPWLALTRIGEINKEIQSAQTVAQASTEPLSESLPKQAMQNMGIGALPQGAPPQGVPPQGVPPQGMPPQGVPPQQAPQGMPPQEDPQMQQQPQGMAGGGLASLHVDPRMFEYGSGGVVAFAKGEEVVDQYLNEDGSETVTDEGGGGSDYDPAAALRSLRPRIEAQMRQGLPPVRTTEEIQSSLNSADKYGVTEGPIGKEYLQGLAALKAAKEADRNESQKDIDQKQRNAVAKALIAFGEKSRGQKGLGGIGAFGTSYMGSTEGLMGEQAALRQNAIRTDELLNEANYKVQELRRAQLKGDVAAERNADIALARIAKDLGVSKNRLIQAEITGNLNLLGRQATAQATIDAAIARAAGTTGAATINKEAKLGAANIGADARRDVANAPPKTGGMAEAATARTELGDRKLKLAANQAILKDDSATKEQKAQARQNISVLQGQTPAVPAAAPMAGAAPAATPAGGVLPTGSTTGKFVPGKGTEVLKDGKLIGYAN